MKYDVVIIGAGPGGLRCGEILAAHGVKTLILERNSQIGRKVCAGGITWEGMIKTIPDHLIKRTFKQQTVQTRHQKIVVGKDEPVVATVNRIELGRHMADNAESGGAELLRGALVTNIEDHLVEFSQAGRTYKAGYDYLVGADGSHSRVRSYLGINSKALRHGIGIQYIVANGADDMVWNFRAELFGAGYSWIFPHKDCTSVGAYLADGSVSPLQLRHNLDDWLTREGINFTKARLEADKINIDYCGWSFGSRFLVGDAAGLA